MVSRIVNKNKKIKIRTAKSVAKEEKKAITIKILKKKNFYVKGKKICFSMLYFFFEPVKFVYMLMLIYEQRDMCWHC